MPIILEMPALSPTMEKGNLVSWLKKEGDEITVGDVIAEIDTDKATMEVEAMHKGILAKILIDAGTHDVLVKTPIAVLKQKNDTDEDIQNAIKNLVNSLNEKPEESNQIFLDVPLIIEPETNLKPDNLQIKISPLAKRIANEFDINISKIFGSGPNGRIVKQDVLSVRDLQNKNKVNRAKNLPKFVDKEITQMKRVIADKLTKSKQSTPHFYMNISANVTNLLEMRKQINDSELFDTKITVNDLVVKAVAMALAANPQINVAWADGKIRQNNYVDISIAVAVEGGLITPIVENADGKSLVEIASEIKDLVKVAKEGKLLPEQFIGGGITVSNLGMFKIDGFSSIINPPQGSILSIGPAKKTPIYNEKNELICADMMFIGYAIDHRVINGADSANFLDSLVKYLENPFLLVI